MQRYLGAVGLLIFNHREFDRRVFKFLAATVIVFFVEDLASALATDINGPGKTIAHLCQVVALYYVYKAFVEVGLRRPYDLLFRSQQQSAEALARSVSMLRGTLESTADGILVTDIQGRIVEYNRRFAEIWQIPPDLIVARREHDFLTSSRDEQMIKSVLGQLKDPDSFLAKVTDLYAQAETPSFDVLEFKDGRTIERYSLPQRISGQAVGRVWSFRDVTDRKRMEESLAAAARKWSITFDAMADGVSVHNSDHTIDSVNQSLCRILGKAKDELIGKKCYQIFHGSDVPAAGCPIERSRVTLRQENTERFEPTLNKWLAVSVSPILDDESHLMRLVHTVRDITERKRAEEALRETQERLTFAVNVGQIGIFDWNVLTDEVAWSQRQEAIFGYPPSAAAATIHDRRDWADRVHPDDLPWVEERIRRAMAERTPYQIEHRVARPDGSIVGSPPKAGLITTPRAGLPAGWGRSWISPIANRPRRPCGPAKQVIAFSSRPFLSSLGV